MFFILIFALSVPFYVVDALTGGQLFPGLPLSALSFVVPVIAASIVTYRESGRAGVGRLLRRSVDARGIEPALWYAPILLLAPALAVSSYFVMRALGMPMPEPQFPIPAALVMLVAFFIAAWCEETGWSGFLIDRLQARSSALTSSLIVGAVWALWHIVPLLQAHRSADWIAAWCLGTLGSRVLIVWLYNNTGRSVLAAILYHDLSNVSWLMFPSFGSHYDPRVVGVMTALVAVTVAVIYGPRTLTRPHEAAPRTD